MKITRLEDEGDDRGFSAVIRRSESRLPRELREVHVSTIKPGMVRGNHYHNIREEFILIYFRDKCRVAWDEGEGTAVCSNDFSDGGVLGVEVDPGQSHAIKNIGNAEIVLVVLSNFAYTTEDPDAFPRPVLP